MHSTPLASLYADHLQTLAQRAARALERGALEHLVVPSGRLHYQLFDDRTYPFAINPQFKAWLPLTQLTDSWLVFTPGKRPVVIYHQPRDYWHAVPAAPSGWWVEHFDIHIIGTPEEALPLLPADPARCAILGEPGSTLAGYAPNHPKAVIDYLDYQRAYKTPYELALMRQAQPIALRAHRAAEAAFRNGASEFDIHMAYCAAAGQDTNELPFSNIVALNKHAAVLHYTDLQRQAPASARSLLVDAGASAYGYAADVSRTHAADPDGEFQALIEAVDTAQQHIAGQVLAGHDYKQLHIDAHLALMGVLRDFDVLAVSPETALATGVSAAFFPHGLGHLVGLQVHDVAGLAADDRGGRIERPTGHPYLRMTRMLEPGMVVTIEPGIYFIDMLLDQIKARGLSASVNWTRVDQFTPYGGIRIEDNVACTDSAPENLTRSAAAG